jgi:hypothetical protein
MAKSGTERTIEWRKALIGQGYKSKTFLMAPATQKVLAAQKKRFGHASELETIELALAQLAASPSNAPAPKPRKR